MRLVSAWGAVSLACSAAMAAVAPSCLLELEHRKACGDGYVDGEAGEECDPADLASYEDACADNGYVGGTADCHPVECTIIADRAQCGYCGDLDIQPAGDTDDDAEECDLTNLGTARCPGEGTPTCTPDCKLDMSTCEPYCGDNQILGDEECEPGELGGIANKRSCTAEAGQIAIPSPYGPLHEYGSGITVCTQCKWPRGQCSYCGNGELDDELSLDNNGLISPAEWCDGDDFDPDRLSSHPIECDEERGSRPNVRCAADCYGFELADDGRDCCVREGRYCPTPEEDMFCCYAYEHPEDREPCVDNGPAQPETCK